MRISEKVEALLSEMSTDRNPKYDLYYCLWENVKQIVCDSNQHLKQITAQMHNYDIHDSEHSEKVLCNIESLLQDEGTNKLTLYEMILIYAAAFLHDSAMALPSWEYDMLSAVEGTNECRDLRLKVYSPNDFKPVQKLSQIVEFVEENKSNLYGDFTSASNFVFCPSSEDKLKIRIAESIEDYEEFRNGYADKLKKLLFNPAEYLNYSELIRTEYIRITHHIIIEKYIQNVKRRLNGKIITIANAGRFVEDLSLICRSHGEDFRYILDLNYKSQIFNNGIANLQYISILLRLGDIIHFSADRAPMSLFAEKRITDPISLKHWKAKFQDLNYRFENRNGKNAIVYSAYCESPDTYYFIQDYIDWIDREIAHYYSLIHNLEFLNYVSIDRYKLPLELQVDREDIKPNKEVFVPETNLKFTLEQSKILELLMGVQLYKDKYLCLRELYQNSLDACRCMKAKDNIHGLKEQFLIEFGYKEKIIDGVKKRYVYCLDNGTGMTKEIVKNYLLRIGNSYYKSRDFISSNIGWANNVTPTSQFGIGILSCYMIGDRIEITTKYCHDGTEAFSFSLDGINERFYYIQPNKLDVEQIGIHGTLVKIFLKDECVNEMNNDFSTKAAYLIHGRKNSSFQRDKEKKRLATSFEHSLFFLVNKQIGIPKKDIRILVRDNANVIHSLIPFSEIFDYRNYPDVTVNEIENLWGDIHYLDGSINPYKDYIAYRDFVKDIPIFVSDENIEIYANISLPLPNIPVQNIKIFDFNKLIWDKHCMLVDGVSTNSPVGSPIEKVLGYDIFSNSIINFIGEIRPLLSIDRNTIVTIPELLVESCNALVEKFSKELIMQVEKHIVETNILPDSYEATLIFDILVRKYPTISSKLVGLITNTKIQGLHLSDLERETQGNNLLYDIVTCKSITLQNIDMREKMEITREVVIGKMLSASKVSVNDSDINIVSDRFEEFPLSEHYHHFGGALSLCTVAIRSDEWLGKYQEYDLASQLWPIVSPRLFDKLNDEHENETLIENRVKTISNSGNGIAGIAQLDPVLINPKFGISNKPNDILNKKKCYVGECENIQNSYWLFEFNNHGDTVRNNKEDFVLFAFIAPRELNEQENLRLFDFNGKDDTYIKGLKEGWSILFVGHAHKYFILPGIVNRSELIDIVPKSVINMDGITYFNVDGSQAF